jgi:hypothetical protein
MKIAFDHGQYENLIPMPINAIGMAMTDKESTYSPFGRICARLVLMG